MGMVVLYVTWVDVHMVMKDLNNWLKMSFCDMQQGYPSSSSGYKKKKDTLDVISMISDIHCFVHLTWILP